jgi:hypothetical protein
MGDARSVARRGRVGVVELGWGSGGIRGRPCAWREAGVRTAATHAQRRYWERSRRGQSGQGYAGVTVVCGVRSKRMSLGGVGTACSSCSAEE